MMRHICTVLKKESIDAFRDRRSLVSASMYAVWAPIAIAFALSAVARDRSADDSVTLAVEGRGRAPALVSYLEQQAVTVIEAPADTAAAVRAGLLQVALVVPANYGSRFEASEPAPIEVLYDGARSGSVARAERVRRLVDGYTRQVADTRLLFRGIAPEVVDVVEVQDRDLSTAAGRAGRLLAMLPVFLLVAAFAGGMSVAIDATAGERERGSLESLLVHPVPPAAFVLGKWGAAVLISAGCTGLMIVTTALVLRLPQVRAIDLPIGLSAADAAAVALVLLPLSLLAPALQMLASVFATSYKEAQTQVSLLLMVPAVPGFLIAFGSLGDQPWTRIVPIVAQQVLVIDVLAGRSLQLIAVWMAAGFTVMATVAALAATARLLVRERVIKGDA